MNVLGLVFSILFILAFGFYACLDKEVSLRAIHKTFISLSSARRELACSYEKEAYKAIRYVKKPSSLKKTSPTQSTQKRKATPPKINPECAKINLWPLLKQEKEDHPILYERLVHLIEHFYEKPLLPFFSKQKDFARIFLDAWIKQLRKNPQDRPILFEQVAFKDKDLQILYYNMLRGAKGKYPSLLDFVKVTPDKKQKLCLLHATPAMLSVFFGDAANAVFEEMHSETLAVTEDRIEEICRSFHYHLNAKEVFPLVNLSRFEHLPADEVTLLAEDTKTSISLRKKILRNK